MPKPPPVNPPVTTIHYRAFISQRMTGMAGRTVQATDMAEAGVQPRWNAAAGEIAPKFRIAVPGLSVADELRRRVHGFGPEQRPAKAEARTDDFAARRVDAGGVAEQPASNPAGTKQLPLDETARPEAVAGRSVNLAGGDRDAGGQEPVAVEQDAETPSETISEPGEISVELPGSGAAGHADAKAFPGESGIGAVASQLVAAHVKRVLFVSPQGNEAVAAAVSLARAIAGHGHKTVLLDLTTSGAASMPMLERRAPGITNLLCGQGDLADFIHGDVQSGCHVFPAGTADPSEAMLAGECLPVILDMLDDMYDVVIVECGPAPVSALQMLAGSRSRILLGVTGTGDARVAETAAALRRMGHDVAGMVSPVGWVMA